MKMKSELIRNPSIALVIVVALAGCGGGGGPVLSTPSPPLAAGPAPAPTPSPTPPPPSAPIPPPPPPPPGSIALVHQGDFAATGFGYTFTSNPNGSNAQGPAGVDPNQRIEFRYNAAAQAYEVLLPGFNRGRVETLGYSGSYHEGQWQRVTGTWNAVTDGASASRQNVNVRLAWPADNTSLALTYTSLGRWQSYASNATRPDSYASNEGLTEGLFAYGIPTAAGDVPRSGTGTYAAVVEGMTAVIPTGVDGGARYPDFVTGTASLTFDFGAGSLRGHMDTSVCPWDCYSVGRYDFTQTVYAAGSTTFSGKFIVPGSSADSAFEGRFTGPQAAELFARWQAPFLHPETGTWGRMFGVWVGKRD